MAVGNWVAIAVFAGVINVHRQAREPFDHVLAAKRGVPTRPARGNVDAGGGGQLVVGNFHFAKEDLARIQRNAAQRGIANSPRLLPDLLQHEVLVATLFRLNRIPLNARDGALDGAAVKVGQFHAAQSKNRHIPVGKKINVARVMQNARNVGGNEGLALTDSDDYWRPESGNHDLVRLGGRQTPQRKRAGEPLDRAPDGHLQNNWRPGSLRIQLHLLDEVSNDLRVGLGNKLVALG